MHASDDLSPSTSDEARQGLSSPSFIGLLVTQLLTAINDNIFRWLAIGIGKDSVHPDHVATVLMAGTVCFVSPYLVLAAPAGYLADRFSKRTVIVGCKAAEIVIIALGLGAIWMDSLWMLFTVLTLMGAQAALFSPAKLGSIPEMLRSDKISAANGLFGLMTVVSTVVGMAGGSWLADVTSPRGQENLGVSAAVLMGVAVAGFLFSLLIKRLPAANPDRPIPWNALWQTWRDLRTLASNPAMLRIALGMVFFWSVGALAQLNIDMFAIEGGAANESAKIPLLVALIFGVGVGSVLAGVWSCGRVELGILPLGAFGVAVSAMLLFTAQGAIFQPGVSWTGMLAWASVLLFFLGASAGLFSVPLESYIQHRAPRESRGSILSATNFLVFAGVILSAIFYMGLRLPRGEGDLAKVLPKDSSKGSIDRAMELDGEFEAAWKIASEPAQFPELKDYLARAEDRDRREAFARLLWTDVAYRNSKPGAGARMRDDYLKLAKDESEAQFASGVLLEASNPLLSSRQIFLLFGALTIPVFIYVVWLIPQSSIRFLVWLGSHTVYRIRVFGRENLPETGGALLAANHVSWADGVLLLLTSSRPIRMVVFSGNFKKGWLNWLANRWGAIMIDPKRPKEMTAAIETARQALNGGELVCIFPEGTISRTGQLQGFRPGLMKILEGAAAPVIPVYLDELWGSVFSFEGGKFFWKLPKRWPYPVSIFFGKPIAEPEDVHRVRQAVIELGASAVEERSKRAGQKTMVMPRAFIRRCKQRRGGSKVADTTGADLKGGEVLLRTLVLRRMLRRLTLAPDERYVGVLLPPSAGGVIVNAALALDRRIAVNLNYTNTSETLNYCLAECGAKHVLTSRKFWSKMSFKLDAEVVFLEDFKDKPTLADKIAGAVGAYAMPAGLLDRQLGLTKIKPDDVMTVIFTSGSTGRPKGVMLTHNNIASNVAAIDQSIALTPKDVLVGILPFFHSLGYTVTLWGVAGLDIKGVYHFSPLDGRQVGRMSKEHGGTCLLSTPTFLRSYLRRCEKEDFAALDVVVTGAERLPSELADAFQEQFGVRPVEGYGTTELSPLVSVNIPPSRSPGGDQIDSKQGTVGRPVPGVSAKVTDLDTGKDLGADKPGMLWIKGPNVMKGYLNNEQATKEAIVDGWYKTGDVALIDTDGFIKITGRISRFSKIGGEMVPHVAIEEAICKLLVGDDEVVKAAVTAVSDPKKGERLIVIHAAIAQSPDEICKALAQQGLPNLFIPSPDSFHQVEKIPVLGTGKADLREIKRLAEEAFGPKTAAATSVDS